MSQSSRKFALAAALAAFPWSLPAITFHAVDGVDARPWTKILGSVGITPSDDAGAQIIVAGAKADASLVKLASDHILILVGESEAAQALGIISRDEKVSVRQICDSHAAQMQIIWEQPAEIHKVFLPQTYRVFASERWNDVPVLAGKRMEHGAVLWLATIPGVSGIERYPYLMQALVDLGLDLPLRTTSLWAFFDSSYRIRADVDYLAKRWRQAGVGELHVAAWHNVEPDAIQDAYLKNLIAACHRNAILVYAWLELPHVSEKFWADHPAWREKTAAGQDAQLDWRELMNLQNPDCKKAVQTEISGLLQRFDWDGVNLAELYFESLEGVSNPARFTPMNTDVRADFKKQSGFDPQLLFEKGSGHEMSVNPDDLRKFLDYRAALATRLQAEWLDVIDQTKTSKSYLDIVLTHIDDRFEPGIRDALGADVAKSLPMIQARNSTLLVEDPATLWSLGPERYSKLAKQYRELTPDRRQIAVDINVVERYQDVYPTKKQTGVELFELVHEAAVSFSRVALYFENSLEKQDLSLLPAAATTATADVDHAGVMNFTATEPTRIAWLGAAQMDGKPWPIQDSKALLAPAGNHIFQASAVKPAVSIADFNGEIRSASSQNDRADLAYTSRSRAIAVFGPPVSSIEVDGAPFWKLQAGEKQSSMLLPAGQHLVSFYR